MTRESLSRESLSRESLSRESPRPGGRPAAGPDPGRGTGDPPSVLITGTSSGIGRDAALFFNANGFRVFAGVRREADGARVQDSAEHPDLLEPVLLDVTDEAAVAAARDLVAERLGSAGLTALVSNAGIAAFSGDASCEGCSLDTQRRVMEINHFGAVRVIQTFLPMLRASRGVVVVNSALMAHTVLPFSAGYAMSKSALEAFADSLRREVAPLGVRVAIIQAALISSELETKQDISQIPRDTPYPAQVAFHTFAADGAKKFAGRPATEPRRVSEAMLRAVRSRHPKPRQIVGGGSRPVWLLGCLPDRVQDAVLGAGLAALTRRSPTPGRG